MLLNTVYHSSQSSGTISESTNQSQASIIAQKSSNDTFINKGADFIVGYM